MNSIILTVHYDNARHIVYVKKGESPVALVEQFQRNLRELGQPDGVTWKVYEGTLAGALIKSFGQVA